MSSPPPFLTFLLLLLPISTTLRHAAAAITYPKQAHPTKSGYLSVNSTSGSSIFYTYYEAQNPNKTTPLSQTPILIWLQGGPGCSSMIANFREIGPYIVNQNLSLEPNKGPWNNLFGLLFLDNPIGTGFSIASSFDEIPRNQLDVSKHLYIAIKKFINLEKSFQERPIYLTGESYAGKYLPSLGYYILKSGDKSINLKGISIGNGLTDPEIQVSTHASNALNLGLINEKQSTLLQKLQSRTIGLIKRRKWGEATELRTRLLDEVLANMTGLATLYDFRRLTPYPNTVLDVFLNHADVKKALRVKEKLVFKRCSTAVGDALHEDVMKSVRHMVEFLVEKTRVLLYQGQCDLKDGPYSSLMWMKEMKWEGIDEFLKAERKVWRSDDGMLAGYVQKWERLSHVVVLNAGHLLPTDQPVNSQNMIQDWVLERGLFGSK